MPADYTPDARYVFTDVTTPAGILQSSPLKTTVDFGTVVIESVQIDVPPGHSGVTGVAVVYDDAGWVPWSLSPSFLVSDDEITPEFVVGMLAGHPFEIWTYNEGNYPHTHTVRFRIADPTAAAGASTPQLAYVAAGTP